MFFFLLFLLLSLFFSQVKQTALQMFQIPRTAFPSWADTETEWLDVLSREVWRENKVGNSAPSQEMECQPRWPRHFKHLTLSYGHCFCDETPWSKAPHGRCQCSELCGQLKKEKHSKRSLGSATTAEGPASEGLNSKSLAEKHLYWLLHKIFSKSISDFQNLLSDLGVVWRNYYLSQSQSL